MVWICVFETLFWLTNDITIIIMKCPCASSEVHSITFHLTIGIPERSQSLRKHCNEYDGGTERAFSVLFFTTSEKNDFFLFVIVVWVDSFISVCYSELYKCPFFFVISFKFFVSFFHKTCRIFIICWKQIQIKWIRGVLKQKIYKNRHGIDDHGRGAFVILWVFIFISLVPSIFFQFFHFTFVEFEKFTFSNFMCIKKRKRQRQ